MWHRLQEASGKQRESCRAIFLSLHFQGKPSKPLGRGRGCDAEGLHRRALRGGAARRAAGRARSARGISGGGGGSGVLCSQHAEPRHLQEHMARTRILMAGKLVAGAWVTSKGNRELSLRKLN